MVLANVSDGVLVNASQELVGNIAFLVTILQAIGGVIIIYIIFSIIEVFINRKRNKKIEQVGEDVKQMNKNLEDIKKLLSKGK